jgi:aminoglycoside phosphotransferase (APT) family kinase protein
MADTSNMGKAADLNREKLYEFLKNHFETDAEFSVERINFGMSNRTYRVRYGTNDMVMRCPPPGANVKSGHDMEREYRVIAGLHPVYARVPRPVVYSADPEIVGAPFYLMERVEGVILRNKPPAGIDLPPELMQKLSKAAIENLAVIHGLDYTQTSLANLGRPQGYVERQITGWIERYARAKTDELPAMERAAAWLSENMPPDAGASIIHNDYKYDNMILDSADLTNIVAVLDWEMATIGDPLMDLGTTLAYWTDAGDPPEFMSMRTNLTDLPGNLNRAELAQHYATTSGRNLNNIVFYYVYGLYKVAVIIQQIHARYKRGLLTGERFAGLEHPINALSQMAVRAIERGRIDNLG